MKNCLTATSSLAVNSQESYDQALVVGKKVSALLKVIDAEEKAITKPINDSLKLIRDKFRPFKEQVEEAKKSIGEKMSAWVRAEEEKKRIAESRIEARVEKGTIKEETAVNKLAKLEESAPVAQGGMTSVLRVEIVDLKQVPVEYLLLNESLVKSDFRAGKEIAGVKCFYEKVARL